jgi:hypothetical protein
LTAACRLWQDHQEQQPANEAELPLVKFHVHIGKRVDRPFHTLGVEVWNFLGF